MMHLIKLGNPEAQRGKGIIRILFIMSLICLRDREMSSCP